MSSIITFTHAEGVVLLTDGGTWWPIQEAGDYVLGPEQGGKVFILPNICAVMASQGAPDIIALVYFNYYNKWTSFDDAVANLKEAIEESHWRLMRREPWRRILVRTVLAGWSDDAQRFVAFEAWVDVDGNVDGPNRIEDDLFMFPYPSIEAFAAIGMERDDAGAVHLALDVADLPLLMQAQRLSRGPIGAEFDPPPEGHFAARYIQRTDLWRDKARTEIVFRWADEAGVAVMPKPGEVEALKAELARRKALQ